MLKVSRMPSGEPEIFRSLQGEGVTAGTPSVFLRLATCNLACTWCDTKYTWDWQSHAYGAEVMALSGEEVNKRVLAFDLLHLVITGGEPMLQQKELAPLAVSLRQRGFFCEVETNGTLVPDAEMVEAISQWNVSPKTASSGNPNGRRELWSGALMRPRPQVPSRSLRRWRPSEGSTTPTSSSSSWSRPTSTRCATWPAGTAFQQSVSY